MTSREFFLCRQIRAGALGDWRELPEDDRSLVSAMASREWVWLDFAGNVELTSKGVAALLAFEESKQRLEQEAQERSAQKAEQKRKDAADKRRSWLQFWLGVIFGWILGGVTFDEFLDVLGNALSWIMGLFQ